MADTTTTKQPAFPANYVTIVHLQQRWLKEQQRKLQEQESQAAPKPQDDPQQQSLDGEKETDFKSSTGGNLSSRRKKNGRRSFGAKDAGIVDGTEIVDLDQNGEGLKVVRKKGKARAKKKVNRGNLENENFPVMRSDDKKEMSNDVAMGSEGDGKKEMSNDAAMGSEGSEVAAAKFENLSLGSSAKQGRLQKSKKNGGIRRDEMLNDERRFENIPMYGQGSTSGTKGIYRGGGKFGHGGVLKGGGAAYVWVRKDEVSRGNAGKVQNWKGSSKGLE